MDQKEQKEKILIKVYKKEGIEELSKDFVAEDSKLETGSLSALTAACACSLLERAAGLALKARKAGTGSAAEGSEAEAAASPEENGSQAASDSNGRPEYIFRNAGIVRNYMSFLVDEDVKCKAPLRKAMKIGGEQEIEACRQPACAICNEIVNMMSQVLELALELKAFCPAQSLHYVRECAHLALAAVRTAVSYILDMAEYLTDDTMKYVIRRENEIMLKKCEETSEGILS